MFSRVLAMVCEGCFAECFLRPTIAEIGTSLEG